MVWISLDKAWGGAISQAALALLEDPLFLQQKEDREQEGWTSDHHDTTVTTKRLGSDYEPSSSTAASSSSSYYLVPPSPPLECYDTFGNDDGHDGVINSNSALFLLWVPLTLVENPVWGAKLFEAIVLLFILVYLCVRPRRVQYNVAFDTWAYYYVLLLRIWN